VDVAEIQETVTDELKKFQREEFSAAFQKLYDHAKACIYMPTKLILNKKSYVSSIFKKISPKTFEPHSVYYTMLHVVGTVADGKSKQLVHCYVAVLLFKNCNKKLD
jgi:hypothetical protein